MKRPATTRGTTRYCTGLTDIVVSASIWLETRIEPSSVAMAEPARLVIINAEKTGASSRARARLTTEPTWFSAPSWRKPSTS